MAYVDNEFSKVFIKIFFILFLNIINVIKNGTKLVAKLRGKDYTLKISKMPFVPTKYHKLE